MSTTISWQGKIKKKSHIMQFNTECVCMRVYNRLRYFVFVFNSISFLWAIAKYLDKD